MNCFYPYNAISLINIVILLKHSIPSKGNNSPNIKKYWQYLYELSLGLFFAFCDVMDTKKPQKKYRSLRKIDPEKKETERKFWLWSYVIIAVIFIAAYFLLKLDVFNVFGHYKDILQKISLGGFISVVILVIAKYLEIIIIKRSHAPADRYNLIRLIKLLSVLLIIMVTVSFLFKNWYAAAASLGIISLILGFSLQTPISSFIGWLYIVIRAPFHVGDRIQVNDFTGDVIEINYLDTTLWEFAGDYLTNDLPSGRLIHFPNSLVFAAAVFNYSWQKFPYIWNEIPFHIAYESDLEYVSKTIRDVAQKELGAEMAEKIKKYKALLEQTPIDEIEIKEYPYVAFRINTNTWVEVILTYLIEPKQAAAIRTTLIKNIIVELLKQPDKVMFPKSNAR
ncbi:MAG: mechanosensitive ion channel [Fimbriimonadaceae bacterium]|nr:mechanosensitive ion channel [Chitinophagales bacterium]